MICGHARELIAASWTGEIDSASESKLKQHLEGCQECAHEMAQLSMLWERLGDIPAPEPSAAMTARWDSTLESMISARRGTSWRFSLQSLWPQRPVWQVSIAVACLVASLTIGLTARRGNTSGPSEKGELAQLREEVASTKQMVALSLMQQQSATERLRGVDYTAKMPAMEPDVVAALLQAVSRDPNVNVQLAAIDALSKVSNDANVRQSLVGSLKMQESPMVQAALIDYVVDAHDKSALNAIKELTARPNLNPLVRQRADSAVQRLTEYK